MSTKPTDYTEAIHNELVLIRKLMVFSLLNSGVSQEKVAGAMGIDQSRISRMFAKTAKSKQAR